MINKILTILIIMIIGITITSCDKNEEIQIKDLSGNWIWTSSCGGFSGLCHYPDKENFKSIEITKEKIIEKINGVIIVNEFYEITNTSDTNNPYEKSYELTFGDDSTWNITLFQNQNKLAIFNESGIGFVDYYKGE